MHLTTRNVNTAFHTLVRRIHERTIPTVRCLSRVGAVLQVTEPILLTYERPTERVLFNPARDANPFFHLYESLWMLAGRNDVAPLLTYVKRMKEFSDDYRDDPDDGPVGTFNGAYGWRWRKAKGAPNLWTNGTDTRGYDRPGIDQLDVLVNHLKADPTSRRAVLSMWNVEDDLLRLGACTCGADRTGPSAEAHDQTCPGQFNASKDVCCNLSVMFALRDQLMTRDPKWSDAQPGWVTPVKYLDMTVTNRSNDMVWGMLGANAVHFSFLQEYLAARLGVRVGKYHHFTNNLHVYVERGDWKPEEFLKEYETGGRSDEWYGDEIQKHCPLVRDLAVFEQELPEFAEFHSKNPGATKTWKEPFFDCVAEPLLTTHHAYKLKHELPHSQSNHELAWMSASNIQADDWRIAARDWLARRRDKKRV